MRRSVKARTDSVAVPNLSEQQRSLNGAGHYHNHCLQCHGAPGVSPHPLAFGMTPEPVNLVSTAREWRPADIHWVIKHGIKMSGMPAWEYRLSDEEIWDIVAFVKAMMYMSPIEYAAISKTVPESHKQAHVDTRLSGPASSGKRSQNAAAPVASAERRTPDNEPFSAPLLGNVAVGRRAIGQYLCATCHEIPGIVGANGNIGPPLTRIGTRRYLGGVIITTPENMVQWLRNPQQIDSLSAMPNLGVTEHDARNMAAYLYTLESLN
jgi:mono/diheme cytochrome c family protein